MRPWTCNYSTALFLGVFFRQLLRPWQVGKCNQKRFDFLSLHLNDGRKNALQNCPAPNQPVRPGPVFFGALSVQQNFLAVLELVDFFFKAYRA